jgi:hypothetical protein
MRANQGPADERIATSNEAALRFRLRADGVADLADHAALRRFGGDEPDAFRAAILRFAGMDGQADGAAPALAALLLEADLRPDDRLLVTGSPPWPWLDALARVVTLVRAPHATPATLREIAMAEAARAVVAPPGWLAAAGLLDAPGAEPRGVRLEGWCDCNPGPPRPLQRDAPS